MKSKDLLKAMSLIEDDRKISKEVVIDALKEALVKAYRKNVELPDIMLRADIDEKGNIRIYQQYTVSETVEDDEMEISLEDAKTYKADAAMGDIIEREVSLDGLSRASATLARNVMKQKIREAEKLAVYDEYIDLLDEMVIGIVESVEEKFTLVNLGKTIAVMPKSAQIPNEYLKEGQKLRVVITAVNKETKGSQVLVSRADAKLVKRLFEKEVPEIFQGIVEIKAIAREAGERTKMAVVSHNPDVDPIGACVGPRGSRVQEIIDELHGEKIDIFEYSDDITELVKNALAPAVVSNVLVTDEGRSLLVIVNEDQLSLAIGKKGKNARLAVKLTNKKIDIKTREELEEQGVDFNELVFQAQVTAEKLKREAASKAIAKMNEESEAREKAKAEAEAAQETIEETEAIVEPTTETVEVEEVEVEKAKPTKKRKAKLEKKADEYVSVFEKLVDTTPAKPKVEKPDYKKKKKKDEEEHKVRNKDLIKDKELDAIKPVYSEDELEEIRRREEEEAQAQYEDSDIDFEDYDEYYDDEK